MYCTAAGACAPERAVGQACDVDAPCVEDAACVADVCEERGDVDDSCAVVPCKDTLECVDTVCVVEGYEGAACFGDSDCSDGLWCENADVDGLCAPVVALGGACAVDDRCANGAYCNGSTCVTSKAAGEACADPLECLSGNCLEAGVCAAVHDGSSCFFLKESLGTYVVFGLLLGARTLRRRRRVAAN
jgi:hypothetical protein